VPRLRLEAVERVAEVLVELLGPRPEALARREDDAAGKAPRCDRDQARRPRGAARSSRRPLWRTFSKSDASPSVPFGTAAQAICGGAATFWRRKSRRTAGFWLLPRNSASLSGRSRFEEHVLRQIVEVLHDVVQVRVLLAADVLQRRRGGALLVDVEPRSAADVPHPHQRLGHPEPRFVVARRKNNVEGRRRGADHVPAAGRARLDRQRVRRAAAPVGRGLRKLHEAPLGSEALHRGELRGGRPGNEAPSASDTIAVRATRRSGGPSESGFSVKRALGVKLSPVGAWYRCETMRCVPRAPSQQPSRQEKPERLLPSIN